MPSPLDISKGKVWRYMRHKRKRRSRLDQDDFPGEKIQQQDLDNDSKEQSVPSKPMDTSMKSDTQKLSASMSHTLENADMSHILAKENSALKETVQQLQLDLEAVRHQNKALEETNTTLLQKFNALRSLLDFPMGKVQPKQPKVACQESGVKPAISVFSTSIAKGDSVDSDTTQGMKPEAAKPDCKTFVEKPDTNHRQEGGEASNVGEEAACNLDVDSVLQHCDTPTLRADSQGGSKLTNVQKDLSRTISSTAEHSSASCTSSIPSSEHEGIGVKKQAGRTELQGAPCTPFAPNDVLQESAITAKNVTSVHKQVPIGKSETSSTSPASDDKSGANVTLLVRSAEAVDCKENSDYHDLSEPIVPAMTGPPCQLDNAKNTIPDQEESKQANDAPSVISPASTSTAIPLSSKVHKELEDVEDHGVESMQSNIFSNSAAEKESSEKSSSKDTPVATLQVDSPGENKGIRKTNTRRVSNTPIKQGWSTTKKAAVDSFHSTPQQSTLEAWLPKSDKTWIASRKPSPTNKTAQTLLSAWVKQTPEPRKKRQQLKQETSPAGLTPLVSAQTSSPNQGNHADKRKTLSVIQPEKPSKLLKKSTSEYIDLSIDDETVEEDTAASYSESHDQRNDEIKETFTPKTLHVVSVAEPNVQQVGKPHDDCQAEDSTPSNADDSIDKADRSEGTDEVANLEDDSECHRELIKPYPSNEVSEDQNESALKKDDPEEMVTSKRSSHCVDNSSSFQAASQGDSIIPHESQNGVGKEKRERLPEKLQHSKEDAEISHSPDLLWGETMTLGTDTYVPSQKRVESKEDRVHGQSLQVLVERAESLDDKENIPPPPQDIAKDNPLKKTHRHNTTTSPAPRGNGWITNRPAKKFAESIMKERVEKKQIVASNTKWCRPAVDSRWKALEDDDSQAKDYKYVESVRCRAKRSGLPCHECPECQAFYSAVAQQGADMQIFEKEDLLGKSRHRAQHTPPSTPPDYWELSFVDEKTQWQPS